MSLSASKGGLFALAFGFAVSGCQCPQPPNPGTDAGPEPSIAFASLPPDGVNCSDDADPNTPGEQLDVTVVLVDGADCTSVTVTNSRTDPASSADGTFTDGTAKVTVTLVGSDAGAENPITATCTTSDGTVLKVTDTVVDSCGGTPITPCDTPLLTIDAPAENDQLTASPTTVSVHTGVSPTDCVASDAQNALLHDGLVTCVADNGTAGATSTIQLATGAGTTSDLALPGDGATTITCTLADDAGNPAFPGQTATASVPVTVSLGGTGGCTISFPTDGGTFGAGDDENNDLGDGVNLPLNGDCPANNPASYTLDCDGQASVTDALSVTPNGDGTFHISTTLPGAFGPSCTLSVHMDALTDPAPITYTVSADVPHLVLDVAAAQSATGFYDLPDDTDTSTADVIDVPITVTPTAFPTTGTFTATLTVTNTRTGQTVDQGADASIDLGSGTAANAVLHVPVGDATVFDATVTAHDASNVQVGPPAGDNVHVDTVAPSAEFFFPNAGLNVNLGADADGDPSNGLQATLVLTVSPDTATCSFALDTVVIPAVHSGTTCSASNVALVDGAHQLTASVTDAAGHTTSAGPLTFNSDGTVPVVTSLVVDQAGADNVLNIADNGGAAPNSVTVTMTVNAAADLEGRQLSVRAAGNNCKGTVTSGVAHLTGCTLQQGVNTLVVSGSDAGGNLIQAADATFSVTVDTVAPTCAVASPAAGTLLVVNDADANSTGMQQDVTVATDAENGQAVDIQDNAASAGPCSVDAGGCSARVTIGEGSRSLTAVCTDAAGNPTTSNAVALTVDSTAPTLTLSAPTIANTANDADAVTPGIQADVTITGDGLGAGRSITLESDVEGVINEGACTSAADGTAATCRVTFTQSNNATHVTATATEASGNVGVSNEATIEVATGTFNLVINNPPVRNGFRSIGVAEDSDGNAGNGAQVIVTGTTDAPDTGLGGTTVQVLVKGVPAVTTCTINNGALSCTPISFADGDTGTFQVTLQNGAEVGATGQRTYRVDLGRPTVTITNPSAANVTFNKASDLVPGGALDVDVTVNVANCENGTASILDGSNVLKTASIDASGSATGLKIRVTTTHEADAETWSATCTDSEANTPATVPSFTAKVDITAPTSPALTSTVTDVRKGIVHVTYTQPGDDANTGTAATVAMFCSKSAITEANFGTGAGQIAITVPTTAGGTATAVDTPAQALAFDNTWNCALRATDDVGNASALATTQVAIATQELVLNAPAGVTGYAQTLSRSRGDINGDGIDDIVVGAPDLANFATSAGGFDVVLGGATAAGVTRTFVTPPATVVCASGSCTPVNAGFQVNVLKSINGDQFDDVAVVTSNGNGSQFILIYAGGPSGIAANQAPATVLEVPAGGLVEVAPQSVGDVDGDGDSDWVVLDFNTAIAYLFLDNGTFPANGTIDARADVQIVNSNGSDGFFAQAVAGIGKLDDGDAIDDFVIDDGGVDPARLFVLHGRQTWTSPVDVASLTGGDVVALARPGSQNGGWDISAGDVNGDLITDVAYLFPGGVSVITGTGTTFAGETTFSIGETITFGAGLAISSVNGDERADIIGGGSSPTTLYFGQAVLASRTTGDATYGSAASGANTIEYNAGNVVASSPEPDIVIADGDAPGTVTIRF